MDIYNFICGKGILSEKHKEELKTKRGFNDETIKKSRFFSGGNYLLEIEPELNKNFTADALVAAGIMVNTGKSPTLSPQLLQDKIIIPYITDNQVSLLRPHKFGLHDVGIQIYQTSWGKNLIITEGEFKAVAAHQLGFNAIALPGVGSFSGEHFPELIKLLNEKKAEDICIIFDSENKSDPNLPNFKANPAHRYDTEYYAYLMAYLLEREGKRVNIGRLPESWRVAGKIDLDGALAQGRTTNDIQQVIASAQSAKDYFNGLDKDAQKIIRKKKDKRYFKSHISISHGCYVATRFRNGEPFPEEISNFTLSIIAIHDTAEGLIREVVMTHKSGSKSKSLSITAEEMNNDAFRTFCWKAGNYVWKGKPDDLMVLWESEFVNAEDMRFIVEHDHIGWLDDEKMWLFGNVAVKDDGSELRPDENGIFWTDKRGIRPIGIVVTTGKNTVNSGVPSLSLTPFDIGEFKSRLADTINPMQANLCLGWMAANLFMAEVFKAHGCFPFLYLRGLKGSGKTKVLSWLLACLGLEGEGYSIESTTTVAAGRYLGYFSSLPVMFDDYRNNEKAQAKDGFFRNVYNRQSAGKGMKSEFGIREVKIRGTVCFGGEETPHDAALLERCIPIFISEKLRDKEHLRWCMDNKINFSWFAYDILKRKKALSAVFMKVLDEATAYFSSKKRNARVSINYAIAVAGYAAAFGEQDVKFAEWIAAETERTAQENRSETMVSMFLDDLLPLKISKKIKDDYWVQDDSRIYLYLHGLYNAWAEDYRKRRGEPPFKQSAIRDYLKDEPGFLETMVNKKINGNNLSCVVFDYETASERLKDLTNLEMGKS